jgi:predicted metal-dependent HD superfamily phosphohydrolase
MLTAKPFSVRWQGYALRSQATSNYVLQQLPGASLVSIHHRGPAPLNTALGIMKALLSTSWSRAWSGLRAAGDGANTRDAVLSRYAEPHRKYHTLQHLHECLSLFETMLDAPDHSPEVEMALWFHDAIYDLKSSNNEDLSATWAEKALLEASVARESASLVRNLVLATKHTALPTTRDEQVLVDIDLSILGASEERFAEYEHQIREEYSYVPSLLFKIKRRAVLRSFLDRPAIYNTPILHGQLEAKARANLAKATAWWLTPRSI